MRTALGMHVAAHSLRAAMVRGNSTIHEWAVPRSGEASLQESLARALATGSEKGTKSSSLCVALDFPLARTKHIAALAALSPRDAALAIRESAHQFFPASDATAFYAVHQHASAVIAERYEGSVVEALQEVAAAVGIRSLCVTSTASALAALRRDGDFVHDSDFVSHRLVARDGLLSEVRECRRTQEAWRDGNAVGDDAFSIPVAATLVRRGVHPAFHVTIGRPSVIPAWRARLAGAAVMLGGVFFLLSPTANERMRAVENAHALEGLQQAAATATDVSARLANVTHHLRVAAAFGSQSPPPFTVTLASLTRALPVGSAVMALSLDSAGGTAVLVSDDMMHVMASLDTSRAIVSPRITGPVTREQIGGAGLERATVHFGWSAR